MAPPKRRDPATPECIRGKGTETGWGDFLLMMSLLLDPTEKLLVAFSNAAARLLIVCMGYEYIKAKDVKNKLLGS